MIFLLVFFHRKAFDYFFLLFLRLLAVLIGTPPPPPPSFPPTSVSQTNLYCTLRLGPVCRDCIARGNRGRRLRERGHLLPQGQQDCGGRPLECFQQDEHCQKVSCTRRVEGCVLFYPQFALHAFLKVWWPWSHSSYYLFFF